MSRMSVSCLLAALVIFGSGGTHNVLAQERTAPQPPATTENSAPQRAGQPTPSTTNDLEITANVTARELRFEAVPEPKVEFTGQPRRETVWEAERQNLPRPVQPGVTYRNIGIQLKITSVFADIDRIVAEALGEVPVTDETPAEKALPPASNTLPASNTTSPANASGRKP